MDKAEAQVTLATLLASDPRPWHVALTDHVHTLESVARDAKVQALRALESGDGSTLDPDTYTRLVDAARLATTVINAAERTGILDRAASAFERGVEIEGRAVARLIEPIFSAAAAWLRSLGLPARGVEAYKRWVALALHDGLAHYAHEMHAKHTGRTPSALPERREVQPPPLDSYVLIRRDELAALRAAAVRANLNEISAKPATDADISRLRASLDEPGPPDRTVYTRPPGVGLISTTATRHFTERG